MLKTWRTSGAGVKNEWSYTSAPPICLEGIGEATLKPVKYELSLSLDDKATTEVYSARWLREVRPRFKSLKGNWGFFFLHCYCHVDPGILTGLSNLYHE
jgi:hypothetical protein